MKTNRHIKNILRLALGLGLVVIAGATSARAANYLFEVINHPLGIKGTSSIGINATGVVLGYYLDANSVAHGYLLKQGLFEAIDHPLGTNGTYPRGVNDTGAVVGNYDATNGTHGFILQNGTYTTLDYPFASSTTAYSICSSGEVVGMYFDGSVDHGFRFKDGVFTTIDNPLGAVPDCGFNAAYGVNASGAVVGEWDDFCGNDPYQNAHLLKDGAYTTINHPNTRDSCLAIGINAGGQVVGILSDFSSGSQGFIAMPVAVALQELHLAIGQAGDTLQLTAAGTTNTQWRLEFRDTLTGTNAWQSLTNITLGVSPFVLDQPLVSSSRF
jgi:uncharacterized membrane protein